MNVGSKFFIWGELLGNYLPPLYPPLKEDIGLYISLRFSKINGRSISPAGGGRGW